MAARLQLRHQDEARKKIKTSQLINRLTNHALGEIDLQPTQVKAIEILLRKTLPDLSAVQLDGEVNLKTVSELGDSELANIATGCGQRVIEAQAVTPEPDPVH